MRASFTAVVVVAAFSLPSAAAPPAKSAPATPTTAPTLPTTTAPPATPTPATTPATTTATPPTTATASWVRAKNDTMRFDVPAGFTTKSSVVQGRFGDAAVPVEALSSVELKRRMFVAAGHASVPLPRGARDDDLGPLTKEILAWLFNPLEVTGVGSFACEGGKCDAGAAKVTDLPALDDAAREMVVVSKSSSQKYRVTFAVSVEGAGYGFAELSYIVVGCPEARAADEAGVVAHIVKSFRAAEKPDDDDDDNDADDDNR